MYIAIICKEIPFVGTWKTITGYNRADVIQAAIKMRKAWDADRVGYRIFIGELSAEIVTPPPQFTEVPITKGA